MSTNQTGQSTDLPSSEPEESSTNSINDVTPEYEELVNRIKGEGEWTDILENKQLLKLTIVPGDQNGERPQRSNKVEITVKSHLLGQPDSLVASECLENAEIFVSEYDVMHGIDLAIPLMYPGETARVLIHPRFGYSTVGKEPDVPPNAAFDCQITLHSVEWIDSEADCSIDDRIKYGSAKKERGNFWFARNEFNSAVTCYRRAIEFLDAQEEEMKFLHEVSPTIDQKSEQLKNQIRQLIELRAVAFNNLAAAQMKTECYDQALTSVNNSLQLNEKNVKALFRKSKILSIKGETADAIEAMKAALALEPSSRSLQNELNKLASLRSQEIQKERKMYQKMLQVTPESNSQVGKKNDKKIQTITSVLSQKLPGNWSSFAIRSTAAAILVLVATIFLFPIVQEQLALYL